MTQSLSSALPMEEGAGYSQLIPYGGHMITYSTCVPCHEMSFRTVYIEQASGHLSSIENELGMPCPPPPPGQRTGIESLTCEQDSQYIPYGGHVIT